MLAASAALSAVADDAPPLLTLSEAIDTALHRSPIYIALANDLDVARLDLESARNAFRTRFTSSMNSSDRTGADLGSTYEVGLSRLLESGSRWGLGFSSSQFGGEALSELKVSYSLPFFGNPAVASRYGVDLARIEEKRRAQLLAVGAEELTVRVIGSYYDAVLAANRARVADSGRDVAEALALVTTVRERAGTSTTLDARRARLRVTQASDRVRTSGLGVERARQGLAALIGMPVDRPFIVEQEVPALDDSEPVDSFVFEERALAMRPELVALREELDLVRSRAREAGAETPPIDVSLQWSLVGEGGSVGESLSLDEQRFGVGVAVALDRGRAANLERRRWLLIYETRRQSCLALENQVRFESRDAVLTLDDARAAAQIAFQELVLANDEFRIAELRYRGGTATTEEALNAEQALADARLGELERRVSYWIARKRIDRASGNLEDRWHHEPRS